MDVLTLDNQIIHLTKYVFQQSDILKFAYREFDNTKPFPLPNVESSTMNLIIHYTLNNDVEITENRDVLFKLAMATDYLNMPVLLDKVCQNIADSIIGKSPKEIRSILYIEEPLI
jgi:hypothetical protein